jgi:secreted PhoX family phosphatase
MPYGNNQMLAVDPITLEAKRFLTGPRGCEITGTRMAPDGRPRSWTVVVRRVDGAVMAT